MNSLLSAVVFALCTLTAVPGAIASLIAGLAYGSPPSFSSTCINIGVNLSTFVLTATCQNMGVGTTTAAIDLNSCISNTNGELSPGGAFNSSCRDIGLSGVELSAQCKDPSGTFINTQIDLSVCFGHGS
ncbi:hypothetical protein B0H13DRAFT_1975068 [Mycena leptocephala]|nr:hypothetical protein B0H13DRAFT_1975068 [Mycena leptocephala]